MSDLGQNTNQVQIINGTTGDGLLVDQNANGQAINVSSDATDQSLLRLETNSNSISNPNLFLLNHLPSNVDTNFTGIGLKVETSRTLTSGINIADSFNTMVLDRKPTVNNASGDIQDTGNILDINYDGTLTSGSLDWTGHGLNINIQGDGVGNSAASINTTLTTDSTAVASIANQFSSTLSSGSQTPAFNASQSDVNINGSASTTGTLTGANATVAANNFIIWNSTGTATECSGTSGIFIIGSGTANGTITKASGTSGAIVHLGTGTITEGAGILGQTLVLSTGTLTDGAALQAESPSNPAGTLTNAYGLRIKDISAGTTNYAIQTGAGRVSFGDQVEVNRTSTAVNVNSSDETIIGVTDTSAARTVTLDSDDVIDGRIIIVKDESGGAATNNITLATEGAETIDGQSTLAINANYGTLRVYSDGTNWFTF